MIEADHPVIAKPLRYAVGFPSRAGNDGEFILAHRRESPATQYRTVGAVRKGQEALILSSCRNNLSVSSKTERSCSITEKPMNRLSAARTTRQPIWGA